MATNFLINGSEFSDNFIPRDAFTQGGLWCWGMSPGWQGQVQFGDGGVLSLATSPISPNSEKNWKQITVGLWHSSAIKTDGTLWSWGYNSGRLGTGDTGNRGEPTKIGSGTNWKQVSSGRQHNTGIKTDGTLWTWGVGYTNAPVQFETGTNWKLGSAGTYHFAGIKTDGTLWTWGANYYGELGDGTTVDKATATQIPGTNWKTISTGQYWSAQLGVKTDGTLWSWGRNHYGQLGDGTGTNRSSPVQITGTTWKMAVSYTFLSAAIKTDGTLWTWGRNNLGQLGDGTTTNRNSPVQVPGTNWKTIGLKDSAMTAIKTDGTLWTWGSGYTGDGTSNSYSSPVQIYGGGTNWKMVTGGGYYMLSIRDDF